MEPTTRSPAELKLNGLDAWRDAVRRHFLVLECSAKQPSYFHCSVLVAQFANSLAAELAVNASRVRRHRRDAEHDAVAHFKIFWQLAGRSQVSQSGRTALLKPGMWCVYDSTREYCIESGDQSRFMVLLVPQLESYGWMPTIEALSGRALDGGGAPRIVMSSLAAMLRDGTPLDAESQRTLQDSTVALMERALASQVRAHGLRLSAQGASRLSRVQEWIRAHVSNTALTAESVAQSFGMSRRSLYDLFLSSGTTPRAFLLQVRLEHACTLLSQPAWCDAPLSQVAQQCGFSDAANFSRAFSLRLGVAPSQWRIRHQSQKPDLSGTALL